MKIRSFVLFFTITMTTYKTWALNNNEKALIKKASQHLASGDMFSEQELINRFDEKMYEKLKKMFSNIDGVGTEEMIYMTYVYSTADDNSSEVKDLKKKINSLLEKAHF